MAHGGNCFYGPVLDIFGGQLNMKAFSGKTTLLLNSASMCSFAPRNMEMLKIMQQHYTQTAPGKVQVLMFPSTDHAHQERMLPEEIISWAGRDYGVQLEAVSKRAGLVSNDGYNGNCPIFLFGRCHVKTMSPNWRAPAIWECVSSTCGPPMWNWTKYIIAADGTAITRLDHLEGWTSVQSAVDGLIKK